MLTDITGQSPRLRFRARFGERNERVLRIAASLGYRSTYWTIDSLDSVEPRKTPEFLIDRITTKTDAELDGAIVLMHVGEKARPTRCGRSSPLCKVAAGDSFQALGAPGHQS